MFLRFSNSHCMTWAMFNTQYPEAMVKYLLFFMMNCQDLYFGMDH